MKENIKFIKVQVTDTVQDSDNLLCMVTNKTNTSIEIYLSAKTDKGIDSKNWFTDSDFEKRFN